MVARRVRMRSVVLAVLAMTMLVPWGGRAGVAAAPAAIAIGDVLPLTGTFASLGEENLWAHQTALDVVNNAHADISIYYAKTQGLPNRGGARLTLVVRDDQSNGALSRTAVIQLITQNRVAWLNGTGISGTTSVIQPVAAQYGIPHSCSSCAAPSLTEKGFKTFWRTGPSDGTMIAKVFTFFKDWPGHNGPADLRRLAVVACDNVFCQDARKVVLARAPGAKFSIVADITTKIGSASMASEEQRLQAANPDVLFVIEYPPDTIVLQNAMKAANWMPRIVMTSDGAFDDTNWLKAQKKTNGAAGWMGRDPTAVNLDRRNPNWIKVNAIYRKYSHGQDMDDLAMREFTGMMWVADVINRARSTDRAALLAAAAATNTPASDLIIDYRGIKFDSHNQNGLAGGVVAQIGWDGEKHVIWPWATAAQAPFPIIFPSPSWAERARHATP